MLFLRVQYLREGVQAMHHLPHLSAFSHRMMSHVTRGGVSQITPALRLAH